MDLLGLAIPFATGYSVHLPISNQPPHLTLVFVVVSTPTSETSLIFEMETNTKPLHLAFSLTALQLMKLHSKA